MQQNSYEQNTQLLIDSREDSDLKHPFINFSNKTSGEVFSYNHSSEI